MRCTCQITVVSTRTALSASSLGWEMTSSLFRVLSLNDTNKILTERLLPYLPDTCQHNTSCPSTSQIILGLCKYIFHCDLVIQATEQFSCKDRRSPFCSQASNVNSALSLKDSTSEYEKAEALENIPGRRGGPATEKVTRGEKKWNTLSSFLGRKFSHSY